MSNDAAFRNLDEMIAKIRALPTSMAAAAAPKAARAVREQFERQIAQGVDPDGKPWKPTADGRKPLRNAAKALTVTVRGTTIIAVLTGHVARHHEGWVKGRGSKADRRRQIFPGGKLPAPIVSALKRMMGAEFVRIMGKGASRGR